MTRRSELFIMAIGSPNRPKVGRFGRPAPRRVAIAVSQMQVVESTMLHAERDNCLPCALNSAAIATQALPMIPRRFRRDAAWWHRHVVMPGMRLHARAVDQEEADDE